MAPCKPIFFCIKQFCLSLFIFLHFEFWIFCIFACRFACFHLHFCCEFLILIKVLKKSFVVFSLPLHLALCFTYAPCCCVVAPYCFVLMLATMPCYSLSPLVACCTLLLVVMPCCLPSCCASHLFLLQVPPATPRLLFHCLAFYVNQYSFPTLLYRWKSLEQQVSSNKLR